MSQETYELIFTDDDLPYEEEILRNPHSVKHWLRYIEAKIDSDAKPRALNLLYERSLKELPGSYKLWYSYLRTRRQQLDDRKSNPFRSTCKFEDVNNVFERALVFMHKMPRIWMEYCEFLTGQCKITRTRRVFDRALRALPITQHNRIWPLYIEFVNAYNIPETGVRVFRRYLKLCPENAEQYIDYLVKEKRLDEAATVLTDLVNNDQFVSQVGKSKHQLWNELCELISSNPLEIKSLDVDAIIRGGLRRYTDQLGHLWTSLTSYYTRSGLFERARDIYEEAVDSVMTVRDFTQIFDAYAQFEELTLSRELDKLAKMTNRTETDEHLVELRLLRFERLIERRPLLLNSVLLRQNPHNVPEWHKRVQLLEGQPLKIISTYTEAVEAVNPKLAIGKLHTLWVEFAKFYEQNGQLNDAREIFEKGTQAQFVKVDDLAAVWCAWAEMELRCENWDGALTLMSRATTYPARKIDYYDDSETVQSRLYKSLKVWSFYADLEESFGTFKTCKSVYDQIIDLRIATPQIVINYGLFLEENQYFEDAFRAYEKGIALFKWPNVYEIWNTYLTKFLKRYKGGKLERARDLFEQCLEKCPPEYARNIFLLYAKLEEDYGMARHAMALYQRATQTVPPQQVFDVFNIYIQRAAEVYGVPKTREIYQSAIEALPEVESRRMCLRFADMEAKLGEIDRARAIYQHCSQMCDPRLTAMSFWQIWKEFEVRHGNEDTMREMLRIKRSVQAVYNTQVNIMSAQMQTDTTVTNSDTNNMRQLEAQALKTADSNIAFVRGGITSDKTDKVHNPDEINIDEDEEEPEVEKQSVPSAVFGNLRASTSNG